MARVKHYAAPVNAMRINAETPCTVNGLCADCRAPSACATLERHRGLHGAEPPACGAGGGESGLLDTLRLGRPSAQPLQQQGQAGLAGRVVKKVAGQGVDEVPLVQ